MNYKTELGGLVPKGIQLEEGIGTRLFRDQSGQERGRGCLGQGLADCSEEAAPHPGAAQSLFQALQSLSYLPGSPVSSVPHKPAPSGSM